MKDDTIVVGAKAIAAMIGLTIDQFYYRARRGRLPVKKQGRVWTANRITLVMLCPPTPPKKKIVPQQHPTAGYASLRLYAIGAQLAAELGL